MIVDSFRYRPATCIAAHAAAVYKDADELDYALGMWYVLSYIPHTISQEIETMRIGVNIPDDLIRRLDPLKPELNLSQICRDAITSHVEKYEKAVAHLNTGLTQDVLNKVYEEEARCRAIVDVDWESRGYENAILWVESASRKDWNDLHKLRARLRRDNLPEWGVEPPISGPNGDRVPCFDHLRREYYQTELSQSDEFLDWLDANGIQMNWDKARVDYGRSWLAYVDAAWDVIRKRREEDQRNLKRERRAARHSRLEPTIRNDLLIET